MIWWQILFSRSKQFLGPERSTSSEGAQRRARSADRLPQIPAMGQWASSKRFAVWPFGMPSEHTKQSLRCGLKGSACCWSHRARPLWVWAPEITWMLVLVRCCNLHSCLSMAGSQSQEDQTEPVRAEQRQVSWSCSIDLRYCLNAHRLFELEPLRSSQVSAGLHNPGCYA